VQSDAPNIPASSPPRPPIYRWECGCRRPAVLLATFDLSGRIEIAQQDRYWQVNGRVATHCPEVSLRLGCLQRCQSEKCNQD
jgi:hypothetical protein